MFPTRTARPSRGVSPREQERSNARREGWRPQDFVGKRVTVEGNPSRRPDGKAMTAGVVTFQDGKVVCLGGCPGGPPIE